MEDDDPMMSGRGDMMSQRELLSARSGKSQKRASRPATEGQAMSQAKTAKKPKGQGPGLDFNDSEAQSILKSKSSRSKGSSHLTRMTGSDEGGRGAMDQQEKKAYKERLKVQIEELEQKQIKFSRKLQDRALQADTSEKDIDVLTKKVNEEVHDLNKLNCAIDDQIKRI
jgi:hypothetical protein